MTVDRVWRVLQAMAVIFLGLVIAWVLLCIGAFMLDRGPKFFTVSMLVIGSIVAAAVWLTGGNRRPFWER